MLPPLRVLHLVEVYPPEFGGGHALTTQEVCRYLAARGHDIRVLCVEGRPDRSPYTLRRDRDGAIAVTRLNLPYCRRTDPHGSQLPFFGWLRHQRRVRELITRTIREWMPDLVDYHTGLVSLGEACIDAVRQLGIPVIATMHDSWLICQRLQLLNSPSSLPCPGPSPLRCFGCVYSHFDGSLLRALAKLPWRLLRLGPGPLYRLWCRRRLLRTFAGAIARSEFIRRVHEAHLRDPVRHIPLGIDLDAPPPKPARRPREPLRLGFLAGFLANKGITDVLTAAAGLKRLGLPFRLDVWGPASDEARSELQARGVEDHVFAHGVFSPDQRWAVYDKIDVLIMATRTCEALGRVVQEAALAGVPTVAPAVGGIPEQIRHGIDGLLYRFADPEDLERHLATLIRTPSLVGLLASNLRPGPRTADAVVALEEFYYQVLGVTSPPGAVQAAGRTASVT